VWLRWEFIRKGKERKEDKDQYLIIKEDEGERKE
jgi:hypothetical protein